MQLATSEPEPASENLRRVSEIAGAVGRQFAILTTSRPGASAAEEQRDNAMLRQELQSIGLPYWLLFGEWREQRDLPTGEWQRFEFVDGTGNLDFSVVVRKLIERHYLRAALVSADGQNTILRRSGEATDLGQLDVRSSVAVYGSALGGSGILTMIRAFAPVGVFGATVRSR